MTRLLGAALFLLIAVTNAAAAPVNEVAAFRLSINLQGHTLKVPFDGNQSLSGTYPSVVRAVILIHGSARNSQTAHETTVINATEAGVNNSTTLMIDPQFVTEEDVEEYNLPSDIFFWDDDGWKEGDQSLSTGSNPRPVRISSFAVLDTILMRIAVKCPNLNTVVIGGHSAGGQFTNRFAAGSPVPTTLASQYGIQTSYIVANPSSYIYMNGERLVSGTTNTWAIPSACSGYNNYKYGMGSRNPYMAAVPQQQIIDQYEQRPVTLLLGELDNNPNGDGVDTDCPAVLQGSHRLARGQTYLKFLQHFYGPGIAARHEALVVPGVGHDSRGMFTSECGLGRMFPESGSCPPAAPQIVLTPDLTLGDPAISKQSDMCIWIHPTNRSLSTIIAADEGVNKLFVYSLSGQTLQVITTSGQPGDIDVRYNFVLGGVPTDIVAFNDRTNQKINVFKVNPTTRLLSRVDNNAIATGSSLGFTLYRSMQTGVYYAFTTSSTGTIKQFRLNDQGGQVTGTQVRTWSVGSSTEGCAADDANGTVFLSQKTQGVWKVGAEPGAPTPGSLVARVGDPSGLTSDAEGIGIYHGAGNTGYLLVSSQGSNAFKAYNLQAPHSYLETFVIQGVTGTAGIDVTNANLGSAFPNGIFVAHHDSPTVETVVGCGFEDTQLLVDANSWDPRTNVTLDVPTAGGTGRVLELTSYPNPFTAATKVRYQLASAQHVELDVLDVAGRVVTTLASGVQDAGQHEVSWSARNARGQRLPNGLYLVRIRIGSETVTRKVVASH